LRRSATVQARESCVVGRVSAAYLDQVGSEHPTLWKRIAKSLAERLLQRNSLITDINARCRVFIISSAEALPVARAVQESFVHDNVNVVVWTDGVFRASQYSVESLIQQLDVSDFAVAVAQADDLVKSRGEEKAVPRDNVLFELGLFIGRLGRHRTFLLEPLREGVKLPSDLTGINTIPYKSGPDAELLPGVAPACNQLRRYFNELGPK
jgi:CRP/FNR family cyclic AMP-dependent transcriptional regulator